MSKAFVKENDNDDSDGDIQEPVVPGGKNYITPHGAKKLQNELKHLRNKERPEITKIVEWAAGNGDRSENGDYLYGKKKLREIDRRIRYLSKRLESAEVVDPLVHVGKLKVFFGASVTIIDENDVEKTYSIVGVDEIDLDKKRISWCSPLGAALLKGTQGDILTFNSPRGAQEIEIIKVEYLEII